MALVSVNGDGGFDHFKSGLERAATLAKTPKLRKAVLLLAFFIFLVALLWKKLLSPFWEEQNAAWPVINSPSLWQETVGMFVRHQFPDMIHIKSLDSSLLPKPLKKGNAGAGDKRRLIFVGDIHGCKRELEALLLEARFDSAKDHLIATGDMINKGPDTAGVIDVLMSYNASCVRGNHEDQFLLYAADMSSTPLLPNTDPKHVNEKAGHKSNNKMRNLAMSLNAGHLEYLRACPVILYVGQVDAFGGDVVVVHAGLTPGLALENQDPSSVMNMRILDLETHVPSKKHQKTGSVPWYKLWNEYQQLLPPQRKLSRLRKKPHIPVPHHTTVIYGHNSKGGLQLHKYTKGLDTGCVNGGQLTALVVDAAGTQTIVQVPGKDYRQSSAARVV